MIPEFNTWYINEDEDEFDIFFKVDNRFIIYSINPQRKRALWWFDERDFHLEDAKNIATKEQVKKHKLDIDKARRGTVKSIYEF